MQKSLLRFCVLLCVAQPAWSSNDITKLGVLSQPEFRVLSEDLGSAMSYKPLTPAAPLGTTGFDMGVEVTQTNTTKSSQSWSKITGGGKAVTDLNVPKLSVAKGLPFGIDIAAFYSKIPTTNISLYGGELSYAILQSGPAQPAVAIRGAFTKMAGVSQLALNTRSLDLSASQGFRLFTPYVGIGRVWVNSTPSAGPVLQNESFTQGKVFVGANMNLIFTNMAAEWDKTGSVRSVSLKLGFRF
jgi:hypothetical protein